MVYKPRRSTGFREGHVCLVRGDSALSPAMIRRMELGIGCENCGRDIAGATRCGHRHCGLSKCRRLLRRVETDVGLPWWRTVGYVDK